MKSMSGWNFRHFEPVAMEQRGFGVGGYQRER